jgi:hypothetical protein
MNSHRFPHRYPSYYPYSYPNPASHNMSQMGNYQAQGEGQHFPPFHYSPDPPRPISQLNQAGYTNTIMNSFKSQDGSFDFNKVMNTAGQMMGTVNQVSSLVKGLGGMFKL